MPKVVTNKFFSKLFGKNEVTPTQAPQESKGLLASKTIWGLILMVVSMIASIIGLDLKPVIEAAMNAHTVEAWFTVLSMVAGIVLNYYGRKNAKGGLK